MVEKLISRGNDWQEKMASGVEQMADLVGSTLGPRGRNVIISRKYKAPLITNDGVTVAAETYLDDPVEDLAAQTLVEIAMKTNEQAGDGTTTSVVIAGQLIKDCLEKVKNDIDGFGNTKSPIALFRAINEARPIVLEKLTALAQPVTPEKLRDIVTTSLENEEFAKTIATMIEEVGEHGHISVEDNFDTKYGIETEVIKGMKFYGTYCTPYMVNSSRREAIWNDTLVIVTNEVIESPQIFSGFADELKNSPHRKLVIIAPKYETAAIQAFAAAIKAAKGGRDAVQVLAVKAPTLTTEELQDLAVYVDAKFFDKNTGMTVRTAKLSDLGRVEQVVVNEDDVVIRGGTGDVSFRLAQLLEEKEEEKDSMFKAKKARRIASLTAGIGIIRVGAMTEQERTYWKYKIEDAVHAARAAMKEGYVPGAGQALSSIADDLGEENVLYGALKAPYEKIMSNAGGVLEILSSVIDPVKVTRLAFENACSAAGTLITTGSGITERRKHVLDLLQEQLMPKEDDFRSYQEKRGPN